MANHAAASPFTLVGHSMKKTDLLGGALLVGFAIAYGLAASSLSMTSTLGIGAGLFPMVLAVLLGILGLAIAGRALVANASVPFPAPSVPYRGAALVTAGPIMFGLLVRPLGLVPALLAAILVSALASRHTSVRAAVLLSIGLTFFCVAVFNWGLDLPLTLFGPWLSF